MPINSTMSLSQPRRGHTAGSGRTFRWSPSWPIGSWPSPLQTWSCRPQGLRSSSRSWESQHTQSPSWWTYPQEDRWRNLPPKIRHSRRCSKNFQAAHPLRQIGPGFFDATMSKTFMIIQFTSQIMTKVCFGTQQCLS